MNSGTDIAFLRSHKIGGEMFLLPSGAQISIQKYFLTFNPWRGTPIPNTYNGKAVIDWNGEPVFAELAVLRLFQSHGWDGVWVDSYRKKYRVGLPDIAEPIEIPEDRKNLLDELRRKTGRYGGCWDVLVWKDNSCLFIELKRLKRDRMQESQTRWLDESVKYGLSACNFAVIEWEAPSL